MYEMKLKPLFLEKIKSHKNIALSSRSRKKGKKNCFYPIDIHVCTGRGLLFRKLNFMYPLADTRYLKHFIPYVCIK